MENDIDLKNDIIITDINQNVTKTKTENRSSLKIQILKRFSILIIFLVIFLISCIGHYSTKSNINTGINNSSISN